jgi:hypothetical protein
VLIHLVSRSRNRLALAAATGIIALGALTMAGFVAAGQNAHQSVSAASSSQSAAAPSGVLGWD